MPLGTKPPVAAILGTAGKSHTGILCLNYQYRDEAPSTSHLPSALGYRTVCQLHVNKIGRKKKKKKTEKNVIGPEQTFLQMHTVLVKRHMKRCSRLQIIREMKIKTTRRYHLTPFRIAIGRKTTNNSLGRMQRKGNLCAVMYLSQIIIAIH